jgi:hypothetical protein
MQSADFRRSHRSLIADAVVARGFAALEIVNESRVQPHTLTSSAHVDGIDVTYPAAFTTESLPLAVSDEHD